MHFQTFLLDVRFMYYAVSFFLVERELQVNLTVVENSTVSFAFIIPPATENISEYRLLVWYKTVRNRKNRIAVFAGDSGNSTKWWGEFEKDSNKASLDNVTGILTLHHAHLHDTDRYLYRISPREPHVTLHVALNLNVIREYTLLE